MSGVWYDVLARELSELNAEVVLMKKFSGDLSYVKVPMGDYDIHVSKANGEYSLDRVSPGEFAADYEEIATVSKMDTVMGIVRRTKSTLQEV